MSIEAQIEVLKGLAKLDTELATLDGELSDHKGRLGGKRELLGRLDEKVGRGQESIRDMEKLRSDLVTELRQISIQIDKAREKLARCRNEREANAAQREIEELHKLRRDRDLEIEKLVGLADEARQEVEVTSGERAGLLAELGESEGSTTVRITELEKVREEKATERSNLLAKLDVALGRKYERVAKMKGSGSAAAVNGCCEACHIALPPMLFQEIMHRQSLHQCPSCHRILYFEPPQAEAENDKADVETARDTKAS